MTIDSDLIVMDFTCDHCGGDWTQETVKVITETEAAELHPQDFHRDSHGRPCIYVNCCGVMA